MKEEGSSLKHFCRGAFLSEPKQREKGGWGRVELPRETASCGMLISENPKGGQTLLSQVIKMNVIMGQIEITYHLLQ